MKTPSPTIGGFAAGSGDRGPGEGTGEDPGEGTGGLGLRVTLRALVIGASGFVGGYLARLLAERGHHVRGTYCGRPGPGLCPLDLRDRSQVFDLVERWRPDVIFNPAARPNVDWCEEFPDESWEVNVTGLGHAVNAAERWGSRLVHFSSEYVFDGLAGPYAETDEPNPLSAYGRQKLAGEKVVLGRSRDGLVVRTTVVYGWERRGKNFVQRLIDEVAADRPVKVPVDQVGSPVYVANLAEAVAELAEKDCRGVYHVAGSDQVDRYTFARAAADTFGLNAALIVPARTSELGQKAPRPTRAGLRVDKARRVLSVPLLGYREGLERMKKEATRWKAG